MAPDYPTENICLVCSRLQPLLTWCGYITM